MQTDQALERNIADFLTDGRAAGLAPKTLAWYAMNLNKWAAWLGERDWMDATATREFLAGLSSRSERYEEHPKRQPAGGALSAFTIRGYIRTLKRFFNWLVQDGRIEENPIARIRLPKKPKRVPHAMTGEDFAKMLTGARTPRDRAVLLMLRDTGARVSELCGLQIRDVDIESGRALVRGKGNKQRYVFLSVTTRRGLQAWLSSRASREPEDMLFVSKRGPLTPQTVEQMLKRIAVRAGVAGRFNPHSLRHAFGRDWILSGGDLSSLSDVLGHSDIETTKIYTMFSTNELQTLHHAHSPGARIVMRGLKTATRPDGEKFLTVAMVAKRLHRSPSLVYKLVEQKKLRACVEPVGMFGELLTCFRQEDVRALIQERRAARREIQSDSRNNNHSNEGGSHVCNG